ncbi:glycosyltransferase [Rathayibacter sp. VKM Ac-2760]|uniref:glycosyltransferase family 2 protein n=1 Tax=Rathayibacter sp. VKM Ac-2760 TaxID=2609253 RepID=UPI001316D03A|nr:glycosyltransferase [Rathayibacter sp. VKM Ac-2760]QHC60056.1 glycosyltransferase [Rathayibacter sp. VKM Ac-2760]
MSGDGAVTVIVVGYAHAAYLPECLDSIRTQTRPADRVLIADDASPDDSREVVAAYLGEHPGFAEFHPNPVNVGLTRTLNRMLALVGTEYVAYLSADDLMLPSRLERHLALLEETGADLAYSDAVVIDGDSRLLHASSSVEFPWPDEPARSETVAECILESNWIPAASLLLRTGTLRAAGGYAESLFFEDFELLVRLACRGSRFSYVEEPLVAVRRLSSSLAAQGFDREHSRYLVAMDAALRHYEDAAPDAAERALSVRWELAKRAGRSDLPWRTRLRMLTAARRGAQRRGAFAFHLLRTFGRSAVRR